MQAIRAGDLFFLDSPFHFRPPTEDSTALEKRLSYLLGTVSARPAVVIRAPSWWDKFNTVTVLPALSKGKPAVVYKMLDRYGHETAAAYPFVPHNPHTIPVSRLGKYIGSLSPNELEELLYAFEWIHDPMMQNDKNLEIPEVYKDVFQREIPSSWRHNKDARSNVDLTINKDTLVVHSRNHPSLDGFPLGDALKNDVPDEVINDVDYVTTTSPLPDAILEEEETYGFIRDIEEDNGTAIDPAEADEDKTLSDEILGRDECLVDDESNYGLQREDESEKPPVVAVERDFPKSIFPVEKLNEVAGRFDFSPAYYNDDLKTRDPKYLTEDEIKSIRGNMTSAEMDELFEYYKKLTPMDAYVLGPRLPTYALQDITGFTRIKAATLKRLCNVMRDIDENDYNDRVVADDLIQAQLAAEKAATRAAAKEQRAKAKENNAELLVKIQQYLSPDKILTMTDEESVNAFLALPMGVVKRAWSGTNFKDAYQNAKAFYKKGMKLYDEVTAKIGKNPDPKTLRETLEKLLYNAEE